MKLYSSKIFGLGLLAFAIHFALLAHCAAQDLPIGQFGITNYGDWQATGTAFRLGPASDALLPQLEIENALM